MIDTLQLFAKKNMFFFFAKLNETEGRNMSDFGHGNGLA